MAEDTELRNVGENLILGKNKAWKGDCELVTDCNKLFHDFGDGGEVSCDTWRFIGWKVLSKVTCFTVGMAAKFVMTGMNTTVVHGKDILLKAFERRTGVPLLSVSNHRSCFDDPGIWGAVLTTSELADQASMRWSASAADISFKNRFTAYFCAAGKVAPIVRGWGVYQQCMNFLLSRLDQGGWVNLFPEGRVNMDHSYIRYKWGVGRLVADARTLPIVIPVFHIGMETVLPNPGPGERQTVLVRPANLVTVNIGRPVDLAQVVEELRDTQASPEKRRKVITDKIEETMMMLWKDTKEKHKENLVNWLRRWHDYTDHTVSILT